MAKARRSPAIKVNGTKKVVTIYKNIPRNKDEEEQINLYVANGYTLKYETKLTVAMMRKELAESPATLEAFNEAYNGKTEGGAFIDSGFSRAIKIYNDYIKSKEKA